MIFKTEIPKCIKAYDKFKNSYNYMLQNLPEDRHAFMTWIGALAIHVLSGDLKYQKTTSLNLSQVKPHKIVQKHMLIVNICWIYFDGVLKYLMLSSEVWYFLLGP